MASFLAELGFGRPDWMSDAACRGSAVGPERGRPQAVWFPRRRGVTAESQAAKAVCMGCPVRQECLDFALTPGHRQKFGIWGGLTEVERRGLQPGALAPLVRGQRDPVTGRVTIAGHATQVGLEGALRADAECRDCA